MTAETSSLCSINSQLQKLLPEGMISTDPAGLEAAVTPSHLLPPGHQPTRIVQTANPDEPQAVIFFANETGLNLTVTSSTGAHRHGGIINQEKNVLIDLSFWQTTDLIDRRNRVCRIEPGVTYGQLLTTLAEADQSRPGPPNGL